MAYEAKIGKKAPFENVNTQGEMKASRKLESKFYGSMGMEVGVRSVSFNTPPHNGVKISGFTQKDYGNMRAVYKDQGTAKVFGKGH